MTEHAEIAIIGGTGVYDPQLFEHKKEIKVHTPYGDTSDAVSIGDYAGRKIAFIPRHGKGHRIPPHRINSRANIWALKELGVKRIVAPSAVGSLQQELRPGDIVLPDQFIDFTKTREYSFYDGGQVCHISMADPFCPELRDIASKTISSIGFLCHAKSTYICIEGPRFSTRAESKFFRESIRGDIIGMTLVPECVLAREAQICYLSLATVTDYDTWADTTVTSESVLETLAKNVDKTRKIVSDLLPKIPGLQSCSCHRALDGAML